MQTETPIEKTNPNDIAERINAEYRSAMQLAGESKRSGQSAVKSALRAGQLLNRAKRLLRSGNWLKWLADNCPDITARTAQNWMRLANTKHVSLEDYDSVRKAYLAIGILSEPTKEEKPIGTATVDVFADIFSKVDRNLSSLGKIADEVKVEEFPADLRHRLLEAAQPVVEMVDKLKALEGAA